MAVTLHTPQGAGDAQADVWAKLAAPLPKEKIAWRQDGKPKQRDGKHFARFVSYVEAGTVRERLDSVVPGEWNLTIELLPPMPESSEEPTKTPCAFKARLTILGVTREDVGNGKDYKQASSDAFKRVAVRFGIGHELYEMEMNWVQMDGDGKYARPLEDPQVAYDRRQSRKPVGDHANGNGTASSNGGAAPTQANGAAAKGSTAPSAPADDVPPCPKCGGRMWDNRIGKTNPRAPDFKCRDRNCDGAIWPPREKKAASGAKRGEKQPHSIGAAIPGEEGHAGDEPPRDDDDLPF